MQFGVLPAEKARPGTLKRALAEGIKRQLFDVDPSASTSEATIFDRTLATFSAKLVLFDAPQPETTELWNVLFPDSDSVAKSGSPASEKATRFEIAFCLALHGLCLALANRRFETDAANVDMEEADDEAGLSESDDVEPASNLWVEYSQAVNDIALLLRRYSWRSLAEDVENSEDNGRAEKVNSSYRLVAAVLLDCLIGSLGQWFLVWQKVERSPRFIELISPDLARRIDSFLAALPYSLTVQPLKQPVEYSLNDNKADKSEDQDCFRVTLIGYRKVNAFMRRLHVGFMQDSNRPPIFANYLEALNIQQAVPWRINRPLLECVSRLSGISIEAAPAGTPKASKKINYQDSEAFLIHPLALSALKELIGHDQEGCQPSFYLPWKADYRGRIYAETPWLTPQGGDMQRALFEFAQGCPLDEQGLIALRRHGGNLVRRDRILADLNISGRQVVSLEERERWVVDHEHNICAWAQDPSADREWREVTSKPWQFLAFCLAYLQWKSDPSVPVRLPVQIDGTCNGLQHIAALTGDIKLAQAVNVLPSDTDWPGDIYIELAQAASHTVGQLADDRTRRDSIHREGGNWADEWLAASPTRRAWLNRDVAKKVVMTIPYGASIGAQSRHVLERIVAEIQEEWQVEPSGELADKLAAWVNESPQRKRFVAKCTRGFFDPLRKRAYGKPGDEEAKVELRRLRVFSAYVARAIVGHLRGALTRRFKAVDTFSKWLRDCAKACAGLPLAWQTPLGFPVCQDKFELVGSSASARLGNESIRIDALRLGHEAHRKKQEDALLPNLIHSLDATHLAMTLRSAHAHGVSGIGSIHDCLLCHPNDASIMGKVVRSSFAQLYATDGETNLPIPLVRWHNWMQLVARLNALPQTYAATLLGSLNEPDGIGERVLAVRAQSDDDAKEVSLVLQLLRDLDPTRRFLARMLLEHVRDAIDSGMRKQTAHTVPAIPALAGLSLDGGESISEYFFC